MKNLVIVESPAKAKTIEGFLGSEFVVKSCYGHIRELPRKGDPIDIENNFNPTYVVPQEKKKVVNELLSIAKKCKTKKTILTWRFLCSKLTFFIY